MNKLKEQLFERYNEDYNVLSENEKRTIVTFDGSDICVLVDKDEKKLYFLVPFNRNHTFEYYPDHIKVDGQVIRSDMFWVDYCNQVIEYQGDVPKVLKEEVINKIFVNFFK